jgi:hypothetical protein
VELDEAHYWLQTSGHRLAVEMRDTPLLGDDELLEQHRRWKVENEALKRRLGI